MATKDWKQIALESPEVKQWWAGMINQYPQYANMQMLDLMNFQKKMRIYDYEKAILAGQLPAFQQEHNQFRWSDVGKMSRHPNLDNAN